MSDRFSLLAGLFLASSVALAQGTANAPTALNVSLDPAQGGVEFTAIGRPSAMHIVGKGPAPEGRFTLKDHTGSGKFQFDLSSLKTGIETRDHHMKDKYLEVAKYPKAELTLIELQLPKAVDGTDEAFTAVPFKGTLKLHGVEKPVSGTTDLQITHANSASQVKGVANFALKLSDYGIAIPSFAGITVAEDVKVVVTGAGNATPASPK